MAHQIPVNAPENNKPSSHLSVISKTQLITLTIVAWIIVCAIYEGFRIESLLAGPPDPDLYVNTWSFQLLIFAMFRFPIWVLALLAVFIVELTFLTRVPKKS